MKSGESEGNELREWTLRVQEIVHGFLGFNMGDPKPQASGTVGLRKKGARSRAKAAGNAGGGKGAQGGGGAPVIKGGRGGCGRWRRGRL